MMQMFSALKLGWKIFIIAIILGIGIFFLDKFTGVISNYRSARFDAQEKATMEKVTKLEKEAEVLRAQKNEFEKRAVEAEAKNAIFENRDKELSAQDLQLQLKTNQVLEEVRREEAITSIPTDAYTRCVRTRQKLLERGIKSAEGINCDTYTKP